jgi:hypothetical protein
VQRPFQTRSSLITLWNHVACLHHFSRDRNTNERHPKIYYGYLYSQLIHRSAHIMTDWVRVVDLIHINNFDGCLAESSIW